MKERFFQSLEKFGVEYNKETGYLSEPIIFIVYKRKSHMLVRRVFLIGEQFVIFHNDTVRKVSFDKVEGFKLEKKA
ncbi:hypothetical protein ACH0BF_22230 [Pseudobacillus sp. 179-B 2D1 NHS]|uniref:hypothetical protein n=1 Tax=Pseudobacillus sp. 179-B 2D1 NHS TaxID=3374292 RepID=UPI0038793859